METQQQEQQWRQAAGAMLSAPTLDEAPLSPGQLSLLAGAVAQVIVSDGGQISATGKAASAAGRAPQSLGGESRAGAAAGAGRNWRETLGGILRGRKGGALAAATPSGAGAAQAADEAAAAAAESLLAEELERILQADAAPEGAPEAGAAGRASDFEWAALLRAHGAGELVEVATSLGGQQQPQQQLQQAQEQQPAAPVSAFAAAAAAAAAAQDEPAASDEHSALLTLGALDQPERHQPPRSPAAAEPARRSAASASASASASAASASPRRPPAVLAPEEAEERLCRFYERAREWQQRREEQREFARRERAGEGADGCTFKPEINATSRRIFAVRGGESRDGGACSADMVMRAIAHQCHAPSSPSIAYHALA